MSQSINVASLYEGWLSGLSLNNLREQVRMPDGRKPSRCTIGVWLRKKYGQKACDRRANSLRRSLFQDLVKGKIVIPDADREATKRWIVESPESDLRSPRFYAVGELKGRSDRDFPFIPELHISEPDEDVTYYQLVTKRGAVWSESDDLIELTQGYQIIHGQIWFIELKSLSESGAIADTQRSVQLFPACKLV